MKKCTHCDSIKPYEEFRKDGSRSDGLYVWCRTCQTERSRKHQLKYQRKLRNKRGLTEQQQLRKENLKKCRDCKEIKPLNEFHSSGKNTKKPHCKNCATIFWKQRRITQMDYLVNKYFGKWECKNCGYNRCRRAFDFHHIESDKKDFTISSAYSASLERLENEIKKCVLLCSNCHRELHYEMDNKI